MLGCNMLTMYQCMYVKVNIRSVTHFCKHINQSSLTFGHSNDTRIRANHEHAEIGGVTCHTKYGRFEILLMSSQVNECDNLSM